LKFNFLLIRKIANSTYVHSTIIILSLIFAGFVIIKDSICNLEYFGQRISASIRFFYGGGYTPVMMAGREIAKLVLKDFIS